MCIIFVCVCKYIACVCVHVYDCMYACTSRCMVCWCMYVCTCFMRFLSVACTHFGSKHACIYMISCPCNIRMRVLAMLKVSMYLRWLESCWVGRLVPTAMALIDYSLCLEVVDCGSVWLARFSGSGQENAHYLCHARRHGSWKSAIKVVRRPWRRDKSGPEPLSAHLQGSVSNTQNKASVKWSFCWAVRDWRLSNTGKAEKYK